MSTPTPQGPRKKDNKSRFWSDYLPASMVRDFRQMLRTKLFLFLGLSSVALLYLWQDSMTEGGIRMLMASTLFLMGVVVPYRVSECIAQDSRDKGSNFLAISPLSSGRIVLGQFLSGALQILFWGLTVLPLYFYAEPLATEAVADWQFKIGGYILPLWGIYMLIFLTAYLWSLFVLALMMALAILPRIGRVAVVACSLFVGFCLLYGIFLFSSWSSELRRTVLQIEDLAPEYFGIFVLMMLYLIPCLLATARRYYASTLGADAFFVRLWTLLCLPALAFSLQYAGFAPDDSLTFMMWFFGCIVFFSFLEEILPRFVDVSRLKFKRGIGGLLGYRSGLANSVFLLLMSAAWVALQYEVLGGDASLYWGALTLPIAALTPAVFLAAFYFNLALTDLTTKYSSRNRIIVYAVFCVLSSLVFSMIGAATDSITKDIAPIHSFDLLSLQMLNVDSHDYAELCQLAAPLLIVCLICILLFALVRSIRKNEY